MSNVEDPKIKDPVLKQDKSLSPLWLFTLLAFSLAGWLVYKSMDNAGERIDIYFTDAQGIEAGRTTVRYQGLEVGIIRKVTLSDDLKSISAQAEIYPEATKILRTNTVFWVVRPKASITGISGLDTLVSGNYIAVQPGDGEKKTTFNAANEPPVNALGGDGLPVQLTAPDLGSLSVGSGVYFKKIRVGEVVDYRLTSNKQNVTVSLSIKKEYADLVKKTSKFWNVSGVNAEIGIAGVDVNIENLASVLAGGIAFDSPTDSESAEALQNFHLYPSINDTDRGIVVKIALPMDHGITNPNAPIRYQGLDVGQLNGIQFGDDYASTFANANINPSMVWLLTDKSDFVIESPEVSLNGIKRASNFITGNTLTIYPGEGKETLSFTAMTMIERLANNPNNMHLVLKAESSWGLKPGTKVIYRGIEVGELANTALHQDDVSLSVVIYADQKHLVRRASRFFILGGISGQIGASGVEFNVPSFSQMISPAISFTSLGDAGAKQTYTLYQSKNHARNAANAQVGFQQFTLIADKLPSVSDGSPVMYKNFEVGKVKGFELAKDSIRVTIQIENRYRHLVTSSTVFWNQSGIDIKAGLKGVEIDTGSLKSIITGGISFGNIEGIDNRVNENWKLYNSLDDAQNAGIAITFSADEASGLSAGSTIRYEGVPVGEVTNLIPEFKQDGITIKAILYPEFASELAKSTSYFWVAQPSLTLTKTENLDSLFGAYISVVPGKGSKRQSFQLHKSAEYSGGLTLVLESESRGSVSVGTPILFRDFEVGSVTDVSLGRFADRVLIEVKITDDYKHLVRDNTVFWNQSGLDVSIGLTGAKVQSGTLESILKGGISFATPPVNSLAKPARSDQHFLLHKAPQEKWTTWRTAIPSY